MRDQQQLSPDRPRTVFSRSTRASVPALSVTSDDAKLQLALLVTVPLRIARVQYAAAGGGEPRSR